MSIKTLKNGPQKLLIIGPDPFISQSSPDHSPQPRIDFSYYEISGPDICSLICGIFYIRANIKSTISLPNLTPPSCWVRHVRTIISNMTKSRKYIFFLSFFVWTKNQIISSQFGEMQQVAGAVSQIIPNKTPWILPKFFIVEVSIPFWNKLLHIVIIVDKNFLSFKVGKISECFFPYGRKGKKISVCQLFNLFG